MILTTTATTPTSARWSLTAPSATAATAPSAPPKGCPCATPPSISSSTSSGRGTFAIPQGLNHSREFGSRLSFCPFLCFSTALTTSILLTLSLTLLLLLPYSSIYKNFLE